MENLEQNALLLALVVLASALLRRRCLIRVESEPVQENHMPESQEAVQH